MKVLVTGAAGFIGSFAAQRFLARGDEVVGLDNLNDYYDVNLKRARLARLEKQPAFRFVKLDLAEQGGMAALFAREKFERVALSTENRSSLAGPRVFSCGRITVDPSGSTLKRARMPVRISDLSFPRIVAKPVRMSSTLRFSLRARIVKLRSSAAGRAANASACVFRHCA